MFDLPTLSNAVEVLIDKAVVKNQVQPIITYSKNKKMEKRAN